MPRLFTALELPERIAGQMALARGGVVGARWLEPEDYHITLRFVGDIDARTARDIAETLGDIRRPKAHVRFEGLSWFGGDKPRAIVAKVEADPALMDLQAEHERRLRRIGVEPETRKFTPHVTLARLRGVAQGESRTISPRAARWGRNRSPPSVSFSIRPATGRAADPMSLRPPIRWACSRDRRSRRDAVSDLQHSHILNRRADPFPSFAGEGGAKRRMGCGPLLRAKSDCRSVTAKLSSTDSCSPHPIRPLRGAFPAPRRRGRLAGRLQVR